ncbi:putative xylanase/chitin deacetylase [Xenococcus sp. PCC 7305]|uniref:polysaccharide deacetylase family protein n=1 Tax=Xenococcus sp. PCC 7305 TaxID=102125 RepID=UPI0002AC6BCB|nr:polysaccharide deacetylase family protein [Xenococcus sp. PCC 7305]ELS02960.1 putative xylanase/chitin deacetylase [Xenococcus sp. PCC 7305]
MNSITGNIVVGISKLFSNAVFYKQTSSPVVSLTIDDVGDSSTFKILHIIDNFNQEITNEQEKVRATFFVITDKVKDPKILEEILSKGHEIGNHGQLDHFHVLLGIDKFRAEMNQLHEILSSNSIEDNIRWFRPGRAFYNGCMFKVLREMTSYYDKFALASMLPLDTLPIVNNPRFTIKYLSRFIFPGSILLLHGGDLKRTSNTVEVLETLLPKLRQQGYQVVTLSKLWES